MFWMIIWGRGACSCSLLITVNSTNITPFKIMAGGNGGECHCRWPGWGLISCILGGTLRGSEDGCRRCPSERGWGSGCGSWIMAYLRVNVSGSKCPWVGRCSCWDWLDQVQLAIPHKSDECTNGTAPQSDSEEYRHHQARPTQHYQPNATARTM